jgi:integrase
MIKMLIHKPRNAALSMDGKTSDSHTMPVKSARVLGPYPNGANFRVILKDGARRKSMTAPTMADAQALKLTLEAELRTEPKHSIGEALSEYIEHCVRDRGIVHLTVSELKRLTAGFLPASAPLVAITPAEAEKLYRKLAERRTSRGAQLSAGTHHVLLGRARAFFRWAVERGDIPVNPFSHVRPIGHKRTGKTQLTIDEARRFKAAALLRANDGDGAALGVLLLLFLGLRAGEVLCRQARDVDDDARILWITRGKTPNARRRLEVPEEIREPLRRLVVKKASGELLFGYNQAGGPKNKAFLWFKVQALCAAAGLPRVSAHSLRGLHSTLALQAGATPHLVAAALGHKSFRITARHYAEPSTLLNTYTRRVNAALQTPAAPDVPDAKPTHASGRYAGPDRGS